MATEILELQLRTTGGDVAASQFGKLKDSATGATNALKLMRDALVLASSVRLAEGVFEIVDSFQRMQNQLLAVLGSQKLVNTAFNDLYNIAQQTRTPLDSTVTLFARMARAGAALGIDLADVEKAVIAVNESFIINASTANEARGAVLQLSHELASGQVRGRSLLSVIQAGPAIAQAFADEMFKLGLTVDKYGQKIQLAGPALYNFVKAHQGLLTGRIAFDALIDGMQKIQEQFDRTNPTIGTLATNIKNAFTYVTGTLLNASGLLSSFNAGLTFLKDNMGDIVSGVGAVAIAFGGWLILDVITAQFAKLFALRGIFGFILSPITNIATGLKNIAVLASDMVLVLYNLGSGIVNFVGGIVRGVGSIFTAASAVFGGIVATVSSVFTTIASAAGPLLASAISAVSATLFAFSGGIQTAFAGLGVGVNIALAASVALSTLAEAFSTSALAANATALAVQFLEYTLVSTTALGAEAIGTVLTITTGFNQLVTVTGSVAEAFVAMGTAALTALGPALIGVFSSILVLLPTLLLGVEGITLAMSALISLGGGLLSLGGAFDGLAGSVLSWHDIFNSFFRVLLTTFDVLSENLPLVFGVIKEQWHNLVYDMISELPVLFHAMDAWLVTPLLKIIDIMAKLAPVIGAAVGAISGGAPGALIGVLAGGAAGLTAQHFKDTIRTQFDALGSDADALTAKAAEQTGTALTDRLFNQVIPQAFAGHAGDFQKAFNLLGKGVSLPDIFEQTGVKIGDLERLKTLKGLLPSPGVVPEDDKKPKFDRRITDQTTIDNLVQSIDPYSKAIAEAQRVTRDLAKAAFDGLDPEKALQNAFGNTASLADNTATIMTRVERNIAGVGNAASDFAGRQHILNDLMAEGKVTFEEYADALYKLRITFYDSVKGNGSDAVQAGIKSAQNENHLAVFNSQPIVKQAVLDATAPTQALDKYRTQFEGLSAALRDGTINQKQFDETLRKDAISALDQQTDGVSGYERALLKLSTAFHNTAADIEDIFTGLFDNIDTQLQSLLKGGKFDFSAIGKNLEDNLAKNTSHQILSPVVDELISQGGFLGTIGAGLGDSLLDNPTGKASDPFYVKMVDTLTGGPDSLLNGLLGNSGGASSGGGNPFGKLGELLGLGGSSSGAGKANPAPDFLSGLFDSIFGGGGSGVSSSFADSNVLGDVSSGFDPSSLLASLPGFATGGSFDVGGSGGTDSQLVAFHATPGENVQINGPGQSSDDGVTVIVNDYRTTSDSKPVETRQTVTPEGRKQIEVLIRDTVNKNIVAGVHDNAMASTYGVGRTGFQR